MSPSYNHNTPAWTWTSTQYQAYMNQLLGINGTATTGSGANPAAIRQPVSYKSYEELEYDRLTALEKHMDTGSTGIAGPYLARPLFLPRWRRWLSLKREYWIIQIWPKDFCRIEEARKILSQRLDGNWTVFGVRDGPSVSEKDAGKRVWTFYLEPIREN